MQPANTDSEAAALAACYALLRRLARRTAEGTESPLDSCNVLAEGADAHGNVPNDSGNDRSESPAGHLRTNR
jgi:hypothetical protein